MANEYPSTNMGLPIPIVGVDPGPDWANNYNASLTIVDAHDHTSGKGVPVTPSGLQINSNLSFLSNSATNLLSSQYISQVTPIATSTVRAAYSSIVSGVSELFWNDDAAHQVQITKNGAVNASVSGIISGTASAGFSSGTLVVLSNTNTPGSVDGGSFIFRNVALNSFGVTVSPINPVPFNYSLTLPTQPVSTLPMTLTPTGIMGTGQITSAMITPLAVGTAQIGNNQVTLQKLALPNEYFSGNISTTTTSTGSVAISGALGALTTTGRSVRVELMAYPTAFSAYFGIQSSTNGGTVTIFLERDATVIAGFLFGTEAATGGATESFTPPGSIVFIDQTPSAGVHTYQLYWQVSVLGTPTAAMNNCQLHLIEY